MTSLYVPWSYWTPAEVHLVSAQSMVRAQEVLLLPTLEPMGSQSPAPPSHNGGVAREQKQQARASSPASKAVRGVVYDGPQIIVSNPPHPDNFIQTIRQPDLVVKMKLPAPLQLPPMVSIAPAKPVLAPPAPPPDASHEPVQVLAAEPRLLPLQQPRVEAPKLPLPAASSADALLHAVASAVAPVPMPKLEQNPSPKSGTDARNILVVNAIAAPDAKPSSIPPGELYGAFTVSPGGATAMNSATGGVETRGAPGIGTTSGAAAGASAAAAGATPNAGVGNKSAGGTGNSKAAGAGIGPDTGGGHGGKGGEETRAGAGAGLRITGNGRGPGTGSGSSPFPGIMIQGGSGGGGRSIGKAPIAGASKPQISYGITIVSSGASGGGFKDFGVFQEEASYTVYLDMADAGAPGSSWTLQYALDVHRAPNSSDPPPRPHGLLVSPYAISKQVPHFSADAVRRSHGSTLVVFGVINSQGKFEDLRIMQGPDPGLSQILLDALRRWTFRPAEIDGAGVPVKVLLGVPVNSVPQE